jgi:hypothetical protein
MPQKSRAQRLNGLFPLSYTGVVPVSPVNFVMDDRPPTVNDSKNFYIGDLWLDTTTVPPKVDNLWMLVDLSGNIATWVNFGAGDLETLTGNSGGPVFPDGADNINVIGDGTTINVVGNPGTNTLTISAVGGLPLVETLTGNSGGAVGPDGANNINVVGTGVITVVGNPGTNTLTVTPSGDIASSFITNPATGTAIPVLGALTFAGAGGIAVSAAGHTVTITNSGTPAPQVAFGAYKSLDSNNVTGDGTFYQVICDGELYDLDNNYDPITGIFTAPTDGTYHFDTYIACHNIADQNLSGLNIETTNVIFHSDLQSPVINKSIDNILHFQLSVDINMNAGDTTLIKIALGGGSGAKVVGVTGAIPPGSPVATYFSGHRIDPAASFITGTETFHTDDGNDVTPDINGLVNVTGAEGITTTGTVGPNTITIHPPASNVIFSVDLNAESNITGDGTTAQVGATAAASLNYDVGGNVNLGGGGTPVTFTAPATGYYQFNLELGVVITNVTGGTEFSGNFISTSGFNSNWGSLPTRNRVANFFASNAAIGIAASALIKMSAADTLIITYVSVGGAKVDGLFGGRLTGYRVA